MSTYLITGVSRGLGFEFLRQTSNDPANTVVGIVRNKVATDDKVAAELPNRKNIHVVQGDMTDYASLKVGQNNSAHPIGSVPADTQAQKAVDETATITGGALDYVIANAAIIGSGSSFDPISVMAQQPERFEQGLLDTTRANVIGNVHLFTLALPLVRRGRAKKVIAISSGMADIELISKFEVADSAIYSVSKAALNAVVAKFSAEHAKNGVLFMSISPGLVETGQNTEFTPEQMQALGAMLHKFKDYAPHFNGPTTPELAVGQVLSVIDKASVEAGDGGSFVSQFGNKQWL
ncbi:Uu.00g089970.m01.CDS01 [Anthostomella pinea]|uniref:Uu.00g089970.m01.CDS01 n=1 Tax=Anthostomella pinea TaxID=933095 RepID=A0AAI8VNR0_9PEZI|nr:Uu.00g089970.m01.CDS01 [Anthostomella pinea]